LQSSFDPETLSFFSDQAFTITPKEKAKQCETSASHLKQTNTAIYSISMQLQ